jgi:hypothetical protein
MGIAGHWGALGLHRLRKIIFVACSVTAIAPVSPAPASEQQDVAGQIGRVTLNIRAQPLAKALATFGEATGFEVIVDGRQAHNLVSSPVEGEMSPDEALRKLIIGTGLTIRDYAPGNVRLVVAPASIAEPEFSPVTSPHASYFAAVQQMTLETICRTDVGLLDSRRLAVMLWFAPSGAVSRVKLLGTLGERGRDAALNAAFERSDVGAPPPPDLKQPITLVVRPQPSHGSRDCGGAGSTLRRASN